jgi:hypothetical protein
MMAFRAISLSYNYENTTKICPQSESAKELIEDSGIQLFPKKKPRPMKILRNFKRKFSFSLPPLGAKSEISFGQGVYDRQLWRCACNTAMLIIEGISS